MKIRKLKIKNLRKISDAELSFNKPLILLYGEIEQGKTTFLDAIKILFSSGFPADLIQHEKKEASIELYLENGKISRSFYISGTGEIKGRPLEAIINNKSVKAKELQKLFNPFQLNQDFLKEMTTNERKRFFVDLFGVDTVEIDSKMSDISEQAKELRSEIKGFGEIEIKEIEKPNIEQLEKKKTEENERLTGIFETYQEKNKNLEKEAESKYQDGLDKWLKSEEEEENKIDRINEINQKIYDTRNDIVAYRNDIQEILDLLNTEYNFSSETGKKLCAEIFEFAEKLPKETEEKIFISTIRPEKAELNLPEFIAPSKDYYNEILEKISDAKADEILYNNYQEALKKEAGKTEKKTDLKSIENELRALRLEKIAKLSEYGKEIENLSFDENGSLKFEGCVNDNLSTSQVVRLGSLLSKLYPESLLDLELLDRAESLGKKIFEFVEKAEKEKKTILATIVGEKPAKVPENIGVFVVDNGKLL